MAEQANTDSTQPVYHPAGGEPVSAGGRELRQTRRRAEILEAAAEEFAKRGYHDASLQRIGDKVGLSKATLYYYVSSKSDLLADLLIAAIDSQPAKVGEGEPVEQLQEFIRTHVSRVCTTVEGKALADNSDVLMSKTAPPNLAAARRRYEDILADILRAGIASAEFRAVPVRPVVKFILAGLNSVPQWYQERGESPLERVVDDIMTILLAGLVASGRSTGVEPRHPSEASSSQE